MLRPISYCMLDFHIVSFCERVKGVTDKDPRRLHFISPCVKQIAFRLRPQEPLLASQIERPCNVLARTKVLCR
jgi:hypothetical protein